MVDRYMKRCSPFLGIWEIQMETPNEVPLHITRLATMKQTESKEFCETGESGDLIHC
jgi:hypothetical protein